MAERLLQHKHCRNCGKAIPADDNYCDDKCQVQYQDMIRKKRNQLYIMMFIAVALMVFTMFSGI